MQRVDAGGQKQGDAVRVDGVATRAPEDLHLAQLDDGELLLAWLERDDAGDGHVMGLVLAADFSAQGKPFALSQFAAHDARFDLAARQLSVGLVYHALDGGTRDAIKYRRIAADGSVSDPAFNVVDAPGRARDASIAAFGQGYAVAFRSLPSLGVDHASAARGVHQPVRCDRVRGGARRDERGRRAHHALGDGGWTLARRLHRRRSLEREHARARDVLPGRARAVRRQGRVGRMPAQLRIAWTYACIVSLAGACAARSPRCAAPRREWRAPLASAARSRPLAGRPHLRRGAPCIRR